MPDPVEPFDIVKTLGGFIDIVIDAGPAELKASSTIADTTAARPQILREGKNAKDIKVVLAEDKK